MTSLDYVVLFATIAAITIYGIWRTRGQGSLSHYLKGDQSTGWAVIGISVMATQASAITFISTPGQGYEDGLGFVQNYFGMPLALIIVAAVFVPVFRSLKVYTAYEYLGQRFDSKTRLLGAGLFLIQRGLSAGITIYAPAIILSTILTWPLDLTIIVSGSVVILYTAIGGSAAVSLTQKYQMAVIFGGMVAALVILLLKLPADVTLTESLSIAGTFNKLKGVDFALDPKRRYTFWSGLLGGLFLHLSYFGTDQSQVQRYLGGASMRESRLGLMFNAVLKIPMQFFILLLGVLVFVFYQFQTPPVFFNQTAWKLAAAKDTTNKLSEIDSRFAAAHEDREKRIYEWLEAKRSGNTSKEESARASALEAHERSEAVRAEAKQALVDFNPRAKTVDTDYVFVTFILNYLPHGLIGLLIAAFFAAALQSKAAELNALASTTTVDFYRHVVRREASDEHYVKASKCFTVFWGIVAVAFALFANLTENLIQAANIVGSIFYGVVLGLFLVAFFVRWVHGTAIFWAAVAAQVLVFILYAVLSISYLWYNLIGCMACIALSILFQEALRFRLVRRIE